MSDWQHGGQQPSGWMWNGSAWVPEPRPGVIPLRPLGLGDILGGSLRTIRRYPGPMLGVSAAVMAVIVAGQSLVFYETVRHLTFDFNFGPDESSSISTSGGSGFEALRLGFDVVEVVFTTLLAGMLTAAIGPAILGQPVSVRTAFGEARKAFWRLLATTVGVGIIIAAVAACLLLPGAIVYLASSDGSGTNNGGIALLVIGGIIAVIGAIYLFVSLSFAAPAVMLEKLSPRNALRRSRQLVRNDWWRVLGITLLAGVISSAVQGVVIVVTMIAALAFGDGWGNHVVPTGFLVGFGLGSFIGGTLARPFQSAVLVLLYVDRRMRTEGLHITLQQAAAGISGDPAAPPAQ